MECFAEELLQDVRVYVMVHEKTAEDCRVWAGLGLRAAQPWQREELQAEQCLNRPELACEGAGQLVQAVMVSCSCKETMPQI